MVDNCNKLDRDDKLRVQAMALFKTYGYERYRTAKFESYEVYRRNKNYIGDESIVTFTSASGKLMALRPDVTLGIVNNLTAGVEKKYCYDENVFRRDEKGEYKELRQVGVEYIGASGSYPEYETVALAIKSLALIGEEYILTIGHMDVVEALLSEISLDADKKEKVLDCIKAKANHELKKLLGEKGDALISLVSTEGEWESALNRAKKITGIKAEKAIGELDALLTALKKAGLDKKVRIDFSLISDYRYYNGIVFTGFIKGVPMAVLTGGRYDNMMKRLGKGESAIGFALDFDAIARLPKEETKYDVVVVYGNAPAHKVAQTVEEETAKGNRTLAVKSDDDSLKAKKRIVL